MPDKLALRHQGLLMKARSSGPPGGFPIVAVSPESELEACAHLFSRV